MDVSLHPAVRSLIGDAAQDEGFSGRVLLTTIFGDALLPRRQPVAVVQLAELVAPAGISDRLVRTSLLRLTRDEIVVSRREGRLSFYRVHPEAEAVFRNANGRIYADAGLDHPWDGEWTVAVVNADVGSKNERLRCAAEFGWLGLTQVEPGVFVSPTVLPGQLTSIAARLGVRLAVLLRGPLVAGTVDDDDHRARQIDPDGVLRRLHETHARRFAPMLEHAPTLAGHDAFLARTLLIDGWRRIALRSPLLPAKLLPTDWQAADNLALTRRLHGALHAASEAHLDAITGEAATSVSLFDAATSAG